MLKWTASAQKLNQEMSNSTQMATTLGTPRFAENKRRKRRATICNKENIPLLTSTPMVVNRTRNSPLVLAPLADILNVTPENKVNRTPERRRVSVNTFNRPNNSTNRRHSTVGFSIPAVTQYAATLPKYEEEYSPSTVIPTGQQLALRGLLPDAFMGNPRYFTTPEKVLYEDQEIKKISSLSKKRKLEQEFVEIAKEQEQALENSLIKKNLNNTGLTSNKMDDETLDNLIDAILDSARKEEKKKKRRKSFNLRRRTLLKNQIQEQQVTILSPSYTAGDDPCSDVSFLNCESSKSVNTKIFNQTTPPPAVSHLVNNSQQATPLIARTLEPQLLLQLPAPLPSRGHDSFSLDTPPDRSKLKRRSESNARKDTNAKKYKVDPGNYFEIGVALPSIYV